MRFVGALAAVGLGIGVLAMHDVVVQRRETWPAESDVLYVPPPSYLQPISLGYREALADLIWVRALIFSGEHFAEGDVEAITRYTAAITGLAPRFHRAYLWGGVSSIYSGAKTIERPMVDAAIAIYQRGIEQFPESHELYYPFGMLLTHQVPSTPGYTDEEIAEARRQGIEHIRRAAAFGADPLVRQYAATLISDFGAEQLAIGFLESQLAQTEDEKYQRLLRKKLEELGRGDAVEQAEQIRTAFMAELRQRKPYLPDTLYSLIRSEHGSIPPTEPK